MRFGFYKAEFTKCLGKVAYHKKTAQMIRNKRGKEGAKLRLYRCDHCGLWHVTHQVEDKWEDNLGSGWN